MIRQLRVRNLAVIEELDLELGPGLNVLTGETGAGKSVLLGAIGLLCGRRVSTEQIRAGAEEAAVEAIVVDPAALARARAAGLAKDADEELLVARALSSGGRSRAYVNGNLCTASLLGEILGESLEVVSQGEHQQLLRPEVQARLLDRYGGLEPAVAALAERHAHWVALGRELRALTADAEERARREDRLRYELEQIEAARLVPGELEALAAERARLRNVDRLAQTTAGALELLAGEASLRDRLAAAVSRLHGAAALDPGLVCSVEGLERAGVELDEAQVALERYAASLEADPARLEAVEQRRAELERLHSRYGPTFDEVLAYRDRARAELEGLVGVPARREERERALEAEAQQLVEAAERLGKGRREAAAALEQAVAAELAALDLRGARFAVRFEPAIERGPEGEPAPCGPRGRERASFLLSANPGEGERRLRDAASGGELARLLLALRNVLREADEPRVLLFDEVDAGIGGRTARRVGARLRSLARTHQTLCITHLPQIAALGQTHFRIAKRVRQGRTATRVERLEGEARTEEIARMSGDGRLTPAARAHARELLAGAGPD